MKLTLPLALAAGLLLAADSPKDDAAKKDLDKLQGTWKLVSYETGGNKAGEEDLAGSKMVIKGNKYAYTSADQDEEGTMKLDPGAKPAAVDLKIESGNDKGKDQVGIYKLEGDTLTFCFAHPGEKERPKEFSGREGSSNLVFVLKREKK